MNKKIKKRRIMERYQQKKRVCVEGYIEQTVRAWKMGPQKWNATLMCPSCCFGTEYIFEGDASPLLSLSDSDFELLMFFKDPKVDCSIMKLRAGSAGSGITFRTVILEVFGTISTKVILQIGMTFRPARALLGMLFRSDVF